MTTELPSSQRQRGSMGTEWSVYNEDGPRTNNHAKGGITKSTAWQERTTQTYKTVELFKTEQAATEVSLLQLEAGGVVEPHKTSVQAKGEKTKDKVFEQRVLFT